MSKNALSFFIRDSIKEAHENLDPSCFPLLWVKAHDVCGVAISLPCKSSLPLSDALQAATWKTAGVIAAFYLKT